MQLLIKHAGKLSNGNHLFEIECGGKNSPVITIDSPWDIQIGSSETRLREELRWYLEDYLKLPMGGNLKRAENVQSALYEWGKSCFDALFNNSEETQNWYNKAKQKGLASLCIKIVSNDAYVLSWPWEAMVSDNDKFLATHSKMVRQLDRVDVVRKFPDVLPKDKLNILFIIARPRGDRDVDYQTLSRPLVDFVNKGNWPVQVDILRPPTFENLKKVLDSKYESDEAFYHIIHFDGHGSYDIRNQTGLLEFEKHSYDDGNGRLQVGENLIESEELTKLLHKYNIPTVVLNACQSAMHGVDDLFSSVAVRLLNAGIHNVTAMSYSLRVAGAEVFVPAFYDNLFKDGDTANAIQYGRKSMFCDQERDTDVGTAKLSDWIIPVLYQQETKSILPMLQAGTTRVCNLPAEVQSLGSYGFIGRTKDIQRLERIMYMKQAGILIYGMIGEGKTTLVKGFLQWLEKTNGLEKVFWLDLNDSFGAIKFIDSLLETDKMTLNPKQKLKNRHCVIVLDNFHLLSETSVLDDDIQLINKFLQYLHGGKTKLLIISRSPERWLKYDRQGISDYCCAVPTAGLRGDEIWQYCDVVLDDPLIKQKKSESLQKLIDKMKGNPYALQTLLSQLIEHSPEDLLSILEDNPQKLRFESIQVALSKLESVSSSSFVPLFRLLGLHENYVLFEAISKMVENIGENIHTKKCFEKLEKSGLCNNINRDSGIYQIHPVLHSYLVHLYPTDKVYKQAFVDEMSSLVGRYTLDYIRGDHKNLSPLHHFFGSNFNRARQFAVDLDMQVGSHTLTYGLAIYAQHSLNFSKAKELYKQHIELATKYNVPDEVAAACHQLSIIAMIQGDSNCAEYWSKKSSDIVLNLDDKKKEASIYHRRGMDAEKKHKLDEAKIWYEKSLIISIKNGYEHLMASAYHHLGRIAFAKWNSKGDIQDLEYAEKINLEAYDIFDRLGDKFALGQIDNELGKIFISYSHWLGEDDMEKKANFLNEARLCFSKSLTNFLSVRNKHEMAGAYYHLGVVEYELRIYENKMDWGTWMPLGTLEDSYKCHIHSLNLAVELGIDGLISSNYRHLGQIAADQGNYEIAKDWCEKSLDIKIALQDEHGIAIVYNLLGGIAIAQHDLDSARVSFTKALNIFERYNDTSHIEKVRYNLSLLSK